MRTCSQLTYQKLVAALLGRFGELAYGMGSVFALGLLRQHVDLFAKHACHLLFLCSREPQASETTVEFGSLGLPDMRKSAMKGVLLR